MSGSWEKTACILCECNCGLEVQIGGPDGRHFTRISGDKALVGSSNAGSVLLFETATGEVVLEFDDPAPGRANRFGSAIADACN